MKSFKKMLRLLGLIFLMVLATIGIGLGGGIPTRTHYRKEDDQEVEVSIGEEDTEGFR